MNKKSNVSLSWLPAFLLVTTVVLGGVFPKSALAYPQPQITNYANVPVTVNVLYSGCSHDSLYIPAAHVEADVITPTVATVSAGHYEQHHHHTHEWWKNTSRGGCLIRKIDVSFHGGGYEADPYKSSGTSYSEFGIYQRSANRFRVMSKHEMNYEKHDGLMSPGFRIHNKTQIPLTISLDQIGCLYYNNVVKPGETFDRNTGAVWFSIKAKLSEPGTHLSTWSCAKPIVEAVAAAAIAVVTLGSGDIAVAAAEGAAEAGAEAGSVETINASAAAVDNLYMKTALTGFSKTVALGSLGDIALANFGANTSAINAGEYAGPPWPFRCTHKPEYEITGGPDFNVCKGATTQSEWDSCVTKAFTGDYPLKITKTNSCS